MAKGRRKGAPEPDWPETKFAQESKDPESCEKSPSVSLPFYWLKDAERESERGKNAPLVSFPVYWLKGAKRGLKKGNNPPLSRFPSIG